MTVPIHFTFYAIVSVALLLTLLIVKYNWNRRKLYALSRKLDGNFALPIVGNMYSLFGSSYKVMPYFIDLLDKYPGPVRTWVGPMLLVLLRSPDDVHTLMSNPNCLEKLEILRRNIPADALFTAPVDKWKKRRKILQTCFNQAFLDTLMDVFHRRSSECIEEFGRHIGDANFDIEHSMRACFLSMLCETQLGVAPKDGELDLKIKELIHIAFQKMHNALYFYDFIFERFPIAKRYYKTHREVYDIIVSMIDEKEKEAARKRPKGETDGSVFVKPFFDKLLEMAEENPEYSLDKIFETLGEFIFAGTDTSTMVACAALIMIAMHPEVEKKLLEELHSIFGNSNRPVDNEDLKRATYVDRVMKETMRLFPVSFIIGRETAAEVKFGDVTVPPGVSVAVCLHKFHRDPKYWKDPLKFDPERFSPEQVAERHPHAFIPFSAGPRNCIGYRYAVKTVKVVLINMTRAYKFKTAYKKVEDVEIEWRVMVKPVDYRVTVERRRDEFRWK